MELLDEIIQKGFKTLNMMEVISPVTAIKAMEMKHKCPMGRLVDIFIMDWKIQTTTLLT
ncbi:hypothetical protein [Cohnella nanjingensis]|uniref:hypothetical protein n=1 Tax=Cohnella nanjingensis TaxID=1387779 RepID=UPI001C879633|nr:hypothetical protein [Cohnella nanjingensis]